jgi:opacity protein-like surface antigen
MTKLPSLKTKLIAASLMTLATVTSANAGIVFSASNFGGGNNVIFNGCSPTPVVGGPAALVSGCLQNSNSTVIDFYGAGENLTISGGQATLDAQDGFFTSGNMKLHNPSQAISAIGFGVKSREVNDNNGVMSFRVDYLDPLTSTTASVNSGNFNLSDNGLNQFSITTNNGWLITNVFFQDSNRNGIEDIRQIRFDAKDRPSQVPLPGSAALLILGAAALRVMRRKA